MTDEKTSSGLSEVQNPLASLLGKLSREHGEFLLQSLECMIKREELPKVPKEVEIIIQGFNTKRKTKEKIDKLVKFLNTIPAIHKAELAEACTGTCIFFEIHGNTQSFAGYEEDTNPVCGRIDSGGDIGITSDSSDTLTDSVFNKWFSETFDSESFTEFTKSLLQLGKDYEKSIPEVPKD